MKNPWPDANDAINQSLLVKRPELAAYILDPDPSTISEYSSKEALWFCDEGHMWYAIVSNKSRSKGSGCPYCYGSPQPVSLEICSQAYGWDPSRFLSHSGKKGLWECSLGHIWTATIAARSYGGGCPFCCNHKLLEGWNDLQTIYPNIAIEADGWDPTTIIYGSSKKMKWKCVNGHKYLMTVYNRTGPNKRGCPACAKSGYDPNEPSYLYLLHHCLWGMLKIGITNNPKRRITLHQSRGWKILEVMGPMDGQLARDREQSILHALKNLGADLGNKNIAGRFDGYTEAWVEESYPAKSLVELVALWSSQGAQKSSV